MLPIVLAIHWPHRNGELHSEIVEKARGDALVRTVQWPTRGNVTVFRRTVTVGAIAGVAFAAATGGALAASHAADTAIAVVAAGMILVIVLSAAAARAQRSAQRSEIVRSFAGTTIVHRHKSILVDDRPMLGEFGTRRDAAWAAARSGRWAVIVGAYNRYYVLTGSHILSERPVSFRNRAVADVVPAFFDGAISA